MKLLEKHHSYFLTIYTPILLICASIILKANAYLLPTFVTQQLFLPILLIFMVFAKPTTISAQHMPQDCPALPLQRSFWLTVCFQATLSVHFIELFRLITIHLPVAQPHPTPAQSMALWQTFQQHWGLFPWAFYTAFGVAAAWTAYRPNLQGFISDTCAPLLGNRKDDAISLILNFCARAYIVGFVMMGATCCLYAIQLLCAYWDIKLLVGYNAPAFFLSAFLMLPVSFKKPRAIMQRLFQNKAPAAFILCLFWAGLCLYAVGMCALFPYIVEHATEQAMVFHALQLPGTWQDHVLWFMGLYALNGCVLAAGFIAYTAAGHSIRQVIAMNLVLPAIFMLSAPLWQHCIISDAWPQGLDLLLSLLSTGILLRFFYRRRSLTALIRVKAYGREHKIRHAYPLTSGLWYGTCIFLSIYVMTGIQVFSFLLWLLAAFPIYIGHFAILGLFKNREAFRWPF